MRLRSGCASASRPPRLRDCTGIERTTEDIMVDGKWIEGLGPLLTVAEAARLTLQIRFEVVRYHLPLALQEADRDPEHVHRLRVGTRRAGAALDIFAQTLPDKLLRKARRLLRSLRRAAG